MGKIESAALTPRCRDEVASPSSQNQIFVHTFAIRLSVSFERYKPYIAITTPLDKETHYYSFGETYGRSEVLALSLGIGGNF